MHHVGGTSGWPRRWSWHPLTVAGLRLGRATAPEEDAPFILAIADLADAPAAHYQGSQVSGTSWDLTVTSDGERIGTIDIDGQQVAVLAAGGKTFAKLPASMLTDLPVGHTAAELEGRWIEGFDSLHIALPQTPGTPAQNGSDLFKMLAQGAHFPKAGSPPVKLGSADALEATTPTGDIYVTAEPPYRVLRVVPAADTQPPAAAAVLAPGAPVGAAVLQVQAAGFSATTTKTTVRPAKTVLAGALVQAADTSDPLGVTDYLPMNEADVDQAYGSLIDQTQNLTDAVNVGVNFTFNETGNLSCSDAACTVTENVVTSTTSAAEATLSGTVTAVMTAQVSVNGESAAGCSQTAPLPLTGDGVMACVDPAVSPIVQQIKAQTQAEADAEAEAEGRDVYVPYTLNYEALVEIEAQADVQAEVERAVNTEKAERDKADRSARCADSSAGPCRARLVDSNGDPLTDPDPIALKLQEYANQALQEWEDGTLEEEMSRAQKAQIKRNPGAANLVKGNLLDARVKQLVGDDASLNTLMWGRGAQGGPDWVQTALGGGVRWYDLTTADQWAAHVRNYGPGGQRGNFGLGVGIIWNG